MKKMSIEEIENDIEWMINAAYEEAGIQREIAELNACTPYHWIPYPLDWCCGDYQWDGREIRHIFGEHCKWLHNGFVGFMDDYGWFRYLPGNC